MAHELDPEYATVGGVLLAPAQLDLIAGWLRPADFAQPVCAEVYVALLEMREAGELIDPVTVLGRLRRGRPPDRGGYLTGELVRMVETVPVPASTPYYGRLVLEAAMFRSIEQVGQRLNQVGRDQRGSVEDAFATVGDAFVLLREQRNRWQGAASASTADPRPTMAIVGEHTLDCDHAAERAVEGRTR